MKQIVLTILSCIGLATFSGCYYDNEEDLYGIQDCEAVQSNYKQVSAIMKLNCVGCHNASVMKGGVNLETYEDVKKYADNGMLIGVVSYSPGFSPMPPDGQLNECDINAIRQWIDKGALNM